MRLASPTAVPRLLALAAVLTLAACDGGTESTISVVRIVGAELYYHEPGSGPSLDVWPETKEVDRIPVPPCNDIYADCISSRAINAVVTERTRLTADRPVQIGGQTLAAGTDLVPSLGEFGASSLNVYPSSVSSLQIGAVRFEAGRTRLTASWETDDGLAFSSSVTVRR